MERAKIKPLFSALVLSFAVAACAIKKKNPLDGIEEEAAKPEVMAFDDGLRALERQDYAKAAKIFDKLLVTKPATERDLITLFNSGSAYEGLGNCQRASERYREVVRSGAGKFTRVEGPALYRLSLAYECMGQHVKTVTALLDARKKGKELPYATLHAEIPARLAAAYARIGNRQKAREYFAQASKGLKTLVAQDHGSHQRETLARTLFMMGQLNPGQRRAEGEGLAYLQGLSMQQAYLLQSAEVGQGKWSAQAADDLNLAYANIWKFKIPEGQDYEYYTRALQTLRELKRIRMPDSPREVEAIFANLAKTESRLQSEMAKVAETTKLTPEAEKREALKQTGRLVDPEKPAAPKAKTKR
ncbi:MAG TPA: hypothetical protein PKC28_02190 [Bdellovibrionales bacterium]|nr:hypothetical protein [Bdellovibrionales bacterium]